MPCASISLSFAGLVSVIIDGNFSRREFSEAWFASFITFSASSLHFISIASVGLLVPISSIKLFKIWFASVMRLFSISIMTLGKISSSGSFSANTLLIFLVNFALSSKRRAVENSVYHIID